MTVIRENILSALATLLGGITTGNGYNLTVVSAAREARIPFNRPADGFPYIDILAGDETSDFNPCSVVESHGGALVVGTVKGKDLVSLESLIADIKNRVASDPTLAGKVIDTKWGPVRTDQGAFEHSTCWLTLRWDYVHDYGSA